MAGGYARERTSLIVTVLNEVETIDALLLSVAAQTCAPDEVIVVDGGSSDGTPRKLERWATRLPLRVLRAPGSTIAHGRNVAIDAATHALIAVTDAGVRLAPDWLEQLLAALREDVHVVSGFFQGESHSAFERVLGATVLPRVADIRADTFLPSSRSVLFRKAAWQQVGGYPEWLDYCEDLVFDLALKQAGYEFAFAPRAIACYRPRRSLRAFFRQYYRYARGDGKADLWRRRHAIRYATYLVTLVLLRKGGVGWLLIALGALAYTKRPFERLDLSARRPAEAVHAAALVPVIRLVGDVAKMLGYPVGVWWRLQRGSWVVGLGFRGESLRSRHPKPGT